MNTAEQLKTVESELVSLFKEQEKINKKIKHKSELKERLLLELNKDNLKDPAWLFRNPTMPGAHEATNKLFEEQYGGLYNGPHPSGYIHNKEYKPIQKNVEFCLRTYNHEMTREKIKKNCEHFLENYLHMFDAVTEISSRWNNKFPEVSVVPFMFRSEESGLDYLGYCPADNRWYHFTLVYGRINTERVFETWDAAFDFAYDMAGRDYNDDDE